MAVKTIQIGEVDTNVLYLTPKEMSDAVRVSAETIRTWVNSDIIDCISYKGRKFFHPDEVVKVRKLQSAGIVRTSEDAYKNYRKRREENYDKYKKGMQMSSGYRGIVNKGLGK